MENTFVYLSPYKEENYNEDMKLRVEELICAVEMEYKHVRQEFSPQNRKIDECLVLFEVSSFFNGILNKIKVIFNSTF